MRENRDRREKKAIEGVELKKEWERQMERDRETKKERRREGGEGETERGGGRGRGRERNGRRDEGSVVESIVEV